MQQLVGQRRVRLEVLTSKAASCWQVASALDAYERLASLHVNLVAQWSLGTGLFSLNFQIYKLDAAERSSEVRHRKRPAKEGLIKTRNLTDTC